MPFTIGTVVSLKSNGLLPLANYDFLSLGGNEYFTTPLMVVSEILYSNQIEIDEESGLEKNPRRGKNKYKCTYFSNKSMKLEENWFAENELEIYGEPADPIHHVMDATSIKWGDVVRFKTVDEEARKTKSHTDGEKQKGDKPLLTFTSPALQIIGFANVDKKEPLIDPYTGEKKREKSKKLIKCKFFNAESDKFSEQLIPIECLQTVDNSGINEKLDLISKYIKENTFILIELEDTKYFGKPLKAHVFSGRYQLIFYNELLKKNKFIWMDLIHEFHELDLTSSSYYPGMHQVNGEDKLIDVPNYLEENSSALKGKKFKIVYRNLKDQIVSRYISIKKVSNPDHTDRKVYYLKSHCFLREDDREFRSDRILSIRTIENEQLIQVLNSILI
jgi:hypothetical protein